MSYVPGLPPQQSARSASGAVAYGSGEYDSGGGGAGEGGGRRVAS